MTWLVAFVRVATKTSSPSLLPLQKTYRALVLVVLVWSWVGLAASQWQGTTYEGWLRQWLALALALTFPPIVQAAWGNRFFIQALGAMAVWTGLIFGAAFLTLQLFGERVAGLELQEFGHRFLGLANDPNQAALVISVALMALFIAWYRLEWSWKAVLPLIALMLVMGRATDSDSFLVAAGFALLAAIAQTSFDRQSNPRPGAALVVGVLVALGLASIFWGLYSQFDALYAKTGQGDLRTRVWTHGVEAWIASPFTGHGPGHFSGQVAPFGAFEAHNLYIDWAAQFGIVGLVVLVALFFRLGLALLREREFAGLGMLAILAILSTFLFFGRHAVFWSGLYLCMVLLATSRKTVR
ncbi:O-antigen ligase family protein [Sphingomicrobium clamense]|uniref:O-antigen ligase family protein n=1 Tax=Sphingomicrobium clamense TaxID=2851013 RepID=UPI0031F33211